MVTHRFEPRQFMKEEYLEFHYFYDEIPPEISFHQHTFYEIFFFLSGDVNYIIEGRNYKLRPGDILFTNKTDIHRPEVHGGKPYERIVVWVEEKYFDLINDYCKEDLRSCFKDAALKDYRLSRPDGETIVHLKRLCEKISRVKESNKPGSNVLFSAYIMEFLVKVVNAYYDTPDSVKKDITENEKINNIIKYINENLSEDFTLDGISKKFYISKSYLSRQFKHFTGLSLYQYIMKKRLIYARNMIRSGTSVTNAYIMCGFNDYSNFLKAFKREFGVNPSEYIISKEH